MRRARKEGTLTSDRFARAALAVALAVTVGILPWLPFPPSTPHEWMTVSIFGALLVAQGLALVVATRRGILAAALVYTLGGFGALVAISHGLMLAEGKHGEAPQTFVVLGVLGGAAMAAAAAVRLLAGGGRSA